MYFYIQEFVWLIVNSKSILPKSTNTVQAWWGNASSFERASYDDTVTTLRINNLQATSWFDYWFIIYFLQFMGKKLYIENYQA